MRFLTVFCLIMLSILLFSVNALAVVYDDEGEVIGEDEIKKEMNKMHRTGVHPGRACVIGGCSAGCIVGALCWWVAIDNLFSNDQIYDALPIVGIASGIGTLVLGYLTGQERDEQAAIERIKAKRRNQRQGYLDSENETLSIFQSTKAHNIDAWGSLGLGYSYAGSETDPGGGIAGRVAVSFQINRALITACATGNTGGSSQHYDSFLGSGTISDQFSDAGLLVGYTINQKEQLRAALSIGIARVWGERVVENVDYAPGTTPESWYFGDPFDLKPFKSFGVPVELSIILIENRFLGLGLIGHTNINTEEIFWGFTLSVLVGNFNK